VKFVKPLKSGKIIIGGKAMSLLEYDKKKAQEKEFFER